MKQPKEYCVEKCLLDMVDPTHVHNFEQAPPESPSEWEVGFDERFTRTNQMTGEPESSWFVRETTTSKDIKEFIRKTIHDHDAAIIKAARAKKGKQLEGAIDERFIRTEARNNGIEAVIHMIEERK